MTNWLAPRSAAVLMFLAIMSLLQVVSFAQEPPAGQPPAQQPPPTQPPNTGGGQQGGRERAPQMPTQERTQQDPFSRTEQIYLSGSVRLPDGSLPPTNVVIERVCNGTIRPEAYTDSKGNFSFLVGGQNAAVLADASVAGPSSNEIGGGQRFDARSLAGCEIRANLAGFLSDSIVLDHRHSLDNPDIGIIRIRRLGNVEGYTFSITTALAPKDARRSYEKSLESIKKQKWADAERELTKAVEVYPKYAVAWYELGRAYQQLKKSDEAKRAYSEAIKIDPKFISPYGQLAMMAAAQQQWEDTARYTSTMLRLNPYLSPEVYFYSAAANYNLNKIDIAEAHAREAAKLDAQHRIPRINHLLGVILSQKKDYKNAAENLQTFLKFSPNAPDAAAVRQLLTEVENAGAGIPVAK
jgi:tetratricopeptide (TPR) repeat protein